MSSTTSRSETGSTRRGVTGGCTKRPGGAVSDSVTGDGDNGQRAGTWPTGCKPPSADTWQRLQAERARRELAVASIRAELQEQPTPRAVRSASRRWCRFITAMADDVSKAKERDR